MLKLFSYIKCITWSSYLKWNLTHNSSLHQLHHQKLGFFCSLKLQYIVNYLCNLIAQIFKVNIYLIPYVVQYYMHCCISCMCNDFKVYRSKVKDSDSRPWLLLLWFSLHFHNGRNFQDFSKNYILIFVRSMLQRMPPNRAIFVFERNENRLV